MFDNGLNKAQTERLVILMEECAETIKGVCKVMRHGFDSTHPDGGPTNREVLEVECGDVVNAINMNADSGDLNMSNILLAAHIKSEIIHKYLHHQLNVEPKEEKKND